ncbi:MAG: sn-glycerol-1-phosphate dehydrogenase [Clostridiaceae bacterium]|nr:sn-glycerol-1-phosphate dehydrogenase [Clostridiaceae bacterium]
MLELVKKFNIETSLKLSNECSCGKEHTSDVKEVLIEQGALVKVPGIIKKYGGSKVFIIADRNTYNAAGKDVCKFIQNENLSYLLYIYDNDPIKPDELAVGKAIIHYDSECDFILGVGSGTINDIGKIVAHITGLPYMIVATAPSMDGYASVTSSVIRDGIKISVDSACPTAIVADLDTLCHAPLYLLQAGIGDMLAKYISICEWKLSHIITGEYYCENIATIVRIAVKKCLNTKALLNRDPEAMKSLTEGLIISGIAMSFAGISRPASGMEHYFSHLWDMRALEFNTPSTLHGIQCGVGTLLCLRIYKFISGITPDRQKALNFVNSFSIQDWNQFLVSFIGKAAEGLIELEKIEGKYDSESHAKRLDIIIARWDEILNIILEELPSLEQVEKYMSEIGMPTRPKKMGYSDAEVEATFLATKDIRNKYVGSRLLWDLGFLDEAKAVCRSDW